MVEIATGQYPYPPESYSTPFEQLNALVHGVPPVLPAKRERTAENGDVDGQEEPKSKDRYIDDYDDPEYGFSEEARDWIARCLVKKPEGRATYKELLVRFLTVSLCCVFLTMSFLGTPLPASRRQARSGHGRVGSACHGQARCVILSTIDGGAWVGVSVSRSSARGYVRSIK